MRSSSSKICNSDGNCGDDGGDKSDSSNFTDKEMVVMVMVGRVVVVMM